MAKLKHEFDLTLAEFLVSILFITIGAALYAVAVNSFIVPNDFGSGGVTGLSILLYYIFKMKIGTMNFIINSILLVLGWRFLEKKTLLFTIYAMTMLSLFMNNLKTPVFYSDNILVTAAAGGVLAGIGLSFILRGNGTSAGTDIIAMMMRKYLGISFAGGLMLCDLIILSSSTYIIGLERLIVTLIMVFILGRTLQYMTEGLNPRKSVLIISDHHEQIASEIASTIDRGITVFHAHGYYSQLEKRILYVVVNNNQIIHLQKLVNQIDPVAFVTVSDVHQVLGEGFSMYSYADRKRRIKKVQKS
ncbi:YitT family protein [Streptococcus ovuberis]|uniref:YitT family protein n=1 Tax=Streptococcus ovuberis TaxID=1936207 RepID=A0A7X6MY10_9STRE|nr:YitT family protein [Streptococcus ovuberis]